MKPCEIEDLRRHSKAKWLTRSTRPFNGKISTDSRTTSEGDLFIAIHGEKFDAHKFLPDVLSKNIAAALIHTEPSPETLALATRHNVALLLVENTIAALNRLAAAYRKELRATVIAVGGSNGKTTTKRIIHTILSQKLHGHASPKSFNNNIGMPLTLLEVSPTHDYVVLEIGTNAPGEIAALGEVCQPDLAVITSIGLEHLEKLANIDGVAQEEAAITRFVADSGTLIIPANSPELLRALKNSPTQKILIGQAPLPPNSPTPDLTATHISESLDGIRFSINDRSPFHVPLLGTHNASNALMAIAVARRLGLSDSQIAAGLAKVQPADGRLQLLSANSWRIINDAYNANPTSMDAAITTFTTVAKSAPRRVAILADMLELGPAAPSFHHALGNRIAASTINLLIAIGPLMKNTVAAATAAAPKSLQIRHFDSTPAARAAIPALLQPNDAILLKGSHSMNLDSILTILQSTPTTPS